MRQKLLGLFLMTVLQVTVAYAQNKQVKGKVTDANDGTGIPGTSVIIKGTNTGTQTDANGNFTLTVPEGKELIFRSIGFGEKTVKVGPGGTLSISLNSQTGDLNEVVVVAFGKAKKESLTGAVTSVTAKDIEKRPITNALGVLEGSAAGIQVNNTTGQPGSEPSIRIRGFSSVNGVNSPLYVIDGVLFAGNISDINPNDIESVSVLKDAASSALYGSKAANGVIIISTKKAAKGNDGSMNVVVNQGVYSRGIKEYKTLNQKDFMETMWQGYRNFLRSTNPTTYPTDAAANAKATSSLVSDYLFLNIFDKPADQLFDANGKMVADAQILNGYRDDLNWFDQLERMGYRQDYSLSGRASGKKSNLYYSVGYLDEKGYLKTSDYKRFTGRINADIQAKEWLKYGFNVAGSHQNSNNSPGGTGSAGSIVSPFNYARSIAPIYPVHLHDKTTGEYVLTVDGEKQFDEGSTTRNQLVGRHTIWENQLNKDKVVRNTLSGQLYLDLRFLKDFTFTVKGDLNVRNSDNATYSNAKIGDGAGQGRASRDNYRYKNYTAQQLLNWGKSYGSHNVDVMVGHENYYENIVELYGYKTKETFANEYSLVNFTSITSLTDQEDNYRSESYLGRARYNFDNKYFVEGSMRRDGSSRFAQDVRWGNFWSIGGSWLLSKENFFLPATKIVDYAKLRVSYGEVGNDASAGRYGYMALYNIDQNANLAALYKSQLESLNMKWETTASISAALEARVYDRVNFTAEYFDKRSRNLLFNVNLPLSAGATSSSAAEAVITKNLGSVSNKGFELTVDVDVIRNKDWRWNVGANATWMKNEIVKLPEQNRVDGIINGNYKYLEGHGIYDFFTYQFVGVDQMTGSALYVPDNEKYDPSNTSGDWQKYLVNINGTNYTTYHTYAKRDWAGTAIPNVYGSFSTGLTWKNLTLSGVFTYAQGGKTYDDSYLGLMSMSGSVGNLHSDLLKAWNGVPEGMTETSPNRIKAGGVPVVDFSKSIYSNAMSSRFLQDGSYFVIKNVGLSYTMPQALLRKIDFNSVRFNLSVENLATFTKLQGMNPQQQFNGRSVSAFVTPRVMSFGVNIGL